MLPRAVSVLAVLLSAAPLAAAQSEVNYGARLSSGVVRLGDQLSLVIVIENAEGEIVALPEVEGLEIGSVPAKNRSRSISLVNGRHSQTVTLTWIVPIRATAVGEYDIPGVELDLRTMPGGPSIDPQRVVTDPLTLTVVEDMRGEELGFFEVRITPERPVEKQPVEIEMLFGWDAGLPRVTYANLILPWWGKLRELLELEMPPSVTAHELTIPLNGRDRIAVEEVARHQEGGRTFRTFRLRRVFLPTRPGTISLSQPFLEFGEADSGGIFSRGRRETFFVAGEPMVIDVRRLPEEGQPVDFTGAIGTFDVRASADTRDVDVGESIKVEVRYAGDGNLQFFDPPDLSRDGAFSGFRVFGSTNRAKSLDRRTIEFDLAPLHAEVTEIPPIRLPVYDPEAGEYTEVATEAIPIRVRALEGEVALAGGEEGRGFSDDIRDIRTAPIAARAGDGPAAPGPLALGLVAAGAVVAWLALRTEVRRRRGDPDAPVERRRRRARRDLARDLAAAEDESDELHALLRFLAARTREPDWAWVGRDPLEFLGDADDPELAEGGEVLALTLGRLERAAYAHRNGEDKPGHREILNVADQLIRGGL